MYLFMNCELFPMQYLQIVCFSTLLSFLIPSTSFQFWRCYHTYYVIGFLHVKKQKKSDSCWNMKLNKQDREKTDFLEASMSLLELESND